MDITIGQRIKERRKELRITQTQIQQETSISSGNLSCIENDKYLPSAVALIELSAILDCSIDWILTGKSSISNNDVILDNKEIILLNSFRELTEDDREEILGLMQIKLKRIQKVREANPKSSHLTVTTNKVG